MPINKEKALKCLAEFRSVVAIFEYSVLDEYDNIIKHCADKWEVSTESAQRYIREGTMIEREDEVPRTAETLARWQDEIDESPVFESADKVEESVFPILCIPDLHIPFEHPSALQFCKDIREKYQPKTVVNLGDLNDQHSLSFHTNEPDAISAQQELDKAKVTCKEWFEAFPNVYLCLGNHDNIPARRAKEMGIPKSYLKSFHDLWDAPKTWNVASSHQIGGVKFTHAGKAGFAGAINSAIIARQSLCVGHQHSFGGVLYQANEENIIFGANSGCLIDNDAYAFRYGKEFPNKPTLGCLIVHSATECQFIPMGGKYLRSNK